MYYVYGSVFRVRFTNNMTHDNMEDRASNITAAGMLQKPIIRGCGGLLGNQRSYISEGHYNERTLCS